MRRAQPSTLWDCSIGPYWAKDIKSVKNTFNARSETAADSFPVSGMHGESSTLHHPSRRAS
jgi:hypothetical protein